MIEEKLFVLLRLGLELSPSEKRNYTVFSDMSEEQWSNLLHIAQEQGVLGIALDGLSHFYDTFDFNIHTPLFIEAIGGMLTRENLNKQQIKVIGDLSSLWARHGLKMMVLKGQVNGFFYPNSLHRDCGDIDCYLLGEYEKGNDVIKSLGILVDEDWEKHSKFCFKGETIENHQFFVQTRDVKWSRSLNNDLLSILYETPIEWDNGSTVYRPSAQFNALFLTYHAMEHFLMGNLRLKQIVDWVMFLEKEKGNVNWEELNRMCHKYNLHDFLGIMNNIASLSFGIELDDGASIDINKSLSERFMQSVLNDKDFIWDNSAGRWYGRFHYIKHVIKNRWKYRIAGRSSYKTLWSYLSNFILRNIK